MPSARSFQTPPQDSPADTLTGATKVHNALMMLKMKIVIVDVLVKVWLRFNSPSRDSVV